MVIGQLIFDGIVMGLVFVILAAGLVVIVSTSKILFLAYAVFYTIGAYTTWYCMHYLNFPYFIAVIAAVACSSIISMLSYLLIFRRLQGTKGGGFLATLIASVGLLMVLTQGGMLIYGSTPQSIPPVFGGILHPFGLNIASDKLALVVMGIAITLFLFFVYEKTNFGRSLRAVAYNREAAALLGINTTLSYMLALAVGCGLAGFAGWLLAPSYGITPEMGNNVLWTVMLMTMLGGIDSLPGAVLAGLIVGQVLSFGQYFIGSTVQIYLFLFIGIVLYFRPNGLMGRGVDIDV
ncbi:MAG: branched-chain amino acid ABC transporter permease [Dehalococcoidia bacterium]|jgi:branched-chain amino acid transport system permease protein